MDKENAASIHNRTSWVTKTNEIDGIGQFDWEDGLVNKVYAMQA